MEIFSVRNMTIELKVASDRDAEKWDNIVETSPHGTIFHKWNWLKIAEKYTKSKLYPIIGYKGDSPIGIFPLFYFRKILLKSVFSPPPHTAMPYLGPVMTNYDELKQDKKEMNSIEFQKRIDEFINEKLNANYVYVSLPPGLLDTRQFKWNNYQVEPEFGYIMDISKGAEYVWNKLFSRKLRQDINRAVRRGVTIEEGHKEELEEVLEAKVYGIRQHNLNLDIPNTWKLHEKIGLEYDTTLGFNEFVGFRWGTCFPFYPLDRETAKPLSLLEIPLIIEDIALFSYNNPWEVCMDIINTVEKYNGVLTILWHHSVFNDIEYPRWREVYEKIIKVCKEKNAWVTNAYEVAKWWKKRCSVNL